MSSKFSHHEACQECGSRNNVGVWTDGSKYCFGCRWFLSHRSMSVKDLKQQLKQQEKQNASIVLPSDCVYALPSVALNWLKKYGISDKEIIQNKFMWSAEKSGLVFPIYDVFGNLLYYQVRRFGENISKGRYDSRGNADNVFHILGTTVYSCITLSEDLISAIKIARQSTAMPLWGSNIPISRIRVLSDRFKNLLIWLDKDKYKYAIKAAFRARPYFDNVRVIYSEKDPKEYDDFEISEFIKGSV